MNGQMDESLISTTMNKPQEKVEPSYTRINEKYKQWKYLLFYE